MNRDKQFIYDFQKHAPKPEKIDLWLNKHKHGPWLKTYRECLDVEARPKHRHRRSISYVRMMALFGDKENFRFTRTGKVISRIKHGKCYYMPKRVFLTVTDGGGTNEA